MTDGILLAELQHDRLLSAYDTLIIDEAHERSLNIDFILGYLKQLLPKRPDLKVIITSATIDPEKFSQHFDGRADRGGVRPHLPGRGPLPAAWSRRSTTRATCWSATRPRRSSTRSRSCCTDGPGDILVFLPGEREIRDTADVLATAGACASRRRVRRRTAVCAALGRRAAPGLRAAHQAARRPGHQRRGDVADRPGHPVRRRHRRRPHLALLVQDQGAAAADRARSARRRRASARGAAAASRRASRSGCTPRRTSTPGRSSPTRRSCAPTSRR